MFKGRAPRQPNKLLAGDSAGGNQPSAKASKAEQLVQALSRHLVDSPGFT